MKPFKNKQEFFTWLEENCDKCRFGHNPSWPCQLQRALSYTYAVDSELHHYYADKIGLNGKVRPCQQFQARDTMSIPLSIKEEI